MTPFRVKLLLAWTIVLSLLSVSRVVWGQTVEVCDLANVVINPDGSTEFWRPNFGPKLQSPFKGTVKRDDVVGTEIIELKASPMTHCEDRVRYILYNRPQDAAPRSEDLFQVDSVTGVISLKASIAAEIPGTIHRFYLYAYYDIGVVGCAPDACVGACSGGVFCCRDYTLDQFTADVAADPVLAASCHGVCPPFDVWKGVFNPTRRPSSMYICSGETRDRDRIDVDIEIVDANVAPTLTCFTSFRVEDSTSVGTVVQTIDGSDVNTGLNGTFRFSLLQRLPTPQSGLYFEIDPINGEITTAGELDHDRRTVFDITVTVTDLAVDPLSNSCDIEVFIDPADEPRPVFPHDPIRFCIDEIADYLPSTFATSSRQIFNLEAFNANTGSVEGMHYRIKHYNPGALATLNLLNFDGVEFFVDEHARALYVRGPVDREEESSYTFEVQAYLNDPSRFTDVTVLVCVNDINEYPFWPQSIYITSLSERAEVGDIVYHLTAQDDDTFANAELRYSMTGRTVSDSIDGEREYHDVGSVFAVDQFGVVRVSQTIGFGYYRFFQFTARTTDLAGDSVSGLSAETEVLIIIVDVNDHAPMFYPLNYTQVRCENHADDAVVPHFLTSVTAYDADHGDAGAVTFSLTGNNSDSFRIFDTAYTYPHLSTLNANVTTTAMVDNVGLLDAETTPLYVLNINAMELTADNPKVGHGHMFFRVCDYNDHTPYFEIPAGYRTSVEENVEDDILIVRIFDDDATLQNRISSLAITSGNQDSLFHLQAAEEFNTWFLFAVNLNYEEATTHQLVLTATNEAQTYLEDCHDVCLPRTRTVTAAVDITVIDRNDNCPYFLPTHYDEIFIAENQPSGTPVTTLTAFDRDQPGTPQSTPVFFMKTDTGRGLFQVNQSSGVVTIHNPPDFEDIHQVTLGVFVHDLGEANLGNLCPEVEATVEIDITNVNDNRPFCVGCPYFVNCLSENSTEGTFVVKVITTDLDWDGLDLGVRAGDPVQYTLVRQTLDGAFAIDANTGVVTVANTSLLNVDSPSTTYEHVIFVNATDGLNLSPEIMITVKICDVNDNCPIFTSGRVLIASVFEGENGESAGDKVFIFPALVAFDNDYTDVNRDTAFVITDSDPPNPPFRLDRYTGELFVTSAGLDYENVRQFVLTIATFDESHHFCPFDARAFATATVTVRNSNDLPPVFITTVYRPAPIPEGLRSNGHLLAILDVMDPDFFGVNVTITTHTTEFAASRQANLDWAIRVNGVQNTPPVVLDRDTTFGTHDPLSGNLIFIIGITATDRPDALDAGPTRRTAFATAVVEVYDINDNAPMITPAAIQRNVSENAHGGYVVAHVVATDIDFGSNADVYYYIAPSQEDFTVDADGAIVTVGPLNHERQESYTFQVYASDRGSPPLESGPVNVNIEVGDLDDHCPILILNTTSITIYEDFAADNSIFYLPIKIDASDRDTSTTNNQLRYFLYPNTGTQPFELEPSDPIQQLNSNAEIRIRKVRNVDHEFQSVHHLRLEVMASEEHCSDTVVIKIIIADIPDYAPRLTSEMYSGSIAENSPVGTVVPITPGIGAIDLDIELDTNQQDPDDSLSYALEPSANLLFAINQDTQTVSLRPGATLDYERDTSYSFRVIVYDRANLSYTGAVTVSVTDENDNAPIIDVEALYNASRLALAAVIPTDPCYGITIDPPTVGTRSLNFSVPETVPVNCKLFGDGVSLAMFTSDADSGTFGQFWFKADHGDDENIGIGSAYPVDTENHPNDPNDAIVFIHEQLDYEVKRLHTVTIRAIDRGSPPLSASLFFYINVINSCDNNPEFEVRSTTAFYCEETFSRVGVLRAVDLDGDNVTYSVLTVTPATLMSQVSIMLVEESVEVWVRDVNYETHKQLTITIEANDNCVDAVSMGLTDQATISVTVLDVNDNFPVITNNQNFNSATGEFFADVKEDPEHPDGPIFVVTGNDVDDGFNKALLFELVSQTPGEKFAIHPASGELRANGTLDFEEYPGPYRVAFRVCDRGDLGENRDLCANNNTVHCSDLSFIVIDLINVADHPPICPDVLHVCVPEDDMNTTRQIIEIRCTDADFTDPLVPAIFTFTVNTVTFLPNNASGAASSFGVEPATGPFGVLSTNNYTLDREDGGRGVLDEYVITVTVGETHLGSTTVGRPSATVTIVVCVNDTNDSPPSFPQMLAKDGTCMADDGQLSISEESTVPHHLFNLEGHDPDLNPTLTYTLKAVTPAHMNYFIMAPNGSLFLNTSVDFEDIRDTFGGAAYTVAVEVSDGLFSATATVCVKVTDANDNAPVFVPPSITLTVNEEPPMLPFQPYEIADLTGYATDRDDPPNSDLVYTLESPFPDDPSHVNHLPFDVRADGLRYILEVTHRLDFETVKEYDVVVVATDQAVDINRRLSGHAMVRIEVTDYADQTPCFNQTDVILEALENQTIAHLLYNNLTHHVFDLDTVPEEFFLFVINPSDLITVGSKSGEVFLHPDNALDFEDPSARERKVTVGVRNTNAHPVNMVDYVLTGFIDITVRAIDINDNPPILDKSTIYGRPQNGYILIPVDHLAEYGQPIGDRLIASDADTSDYFGFVQFRRYDPPSGEPFVFDVDSNGTLFTLATFKDRVGYTYNFTVEAFDNLMRDVYFSDFVVIKTIIISDEYRVILTLKNEISVVEEMIEQIVMCLDQITGRTTVVDKLRFAASDDGSSVDVSRTDIIFVSLEAGTDNLDSADLMVHLLDANYFDLNRCLGSNIAANKSARVYPPTINLYNLEIPGLIIAIIVMVVIILLVCLVCCVLCCWENRRRKSYKKKLAYLTFDEGKFVTQNPLFTPAMEAVQETNMADDGRVVDFDVQEIAVDMEREEEEEEDWLKMDEPPAWLQREDRTTEEYEDWAPPPVQFREVEVTVPEPQVEERTEVVVEEVLKKVVKQESVVDEDVDVTMTMSRPKRKPVQKDYEEQEQEVQIFPSYDSDGLDSDAELQLEGLPSGMLSGDDEIELDQEADFGQEAFQTDQQFDDDFLADFK